MANVVTAPRSSLATLVVVGPADRLGATSESLADICEAGSLRPVLVTTASEGRPKGVAANVAVIEQVPPQYLNNAIAALRLSSLPTVVWWRGGPPEELDGVAPLADRVVLDAEEALSLWQRLPPLFERTALSDLRWARLTRWRGAMAQFFDLAGVRDATDGFTRLTVAGSDRAQCALYAGWLAASLPSGSQLSIDLRDAKRSIESAVLEGSAGTLSLRTAPSGSCLSTRAEIGGHELGARVLSLGDESLAALLMQEMRVRSRDVAFERAVPQAVAVLERASAS